MGLGSSETRDPASFLRGRLSPLGLLGCLHQAQLFSAKCKVKEQFEWSPGAHGWAAKMVTVDAPNVSLESVALGPYPRGGAASTKGRLLSPHLVLDGACWLQGCSLLVWGHCALCG